MANHAILIQKQVQAANIDALNRSVVATADIDNGNVFTLGAVSTDADKGEVFTAVQPATGNLKISLKLLKTTYISIADGSIGSQRQTAYKFEVVDNSGNFWMACEPEVVTISVNGKKFKGFDVDVRDFVNSTGTVFTAFKPQVGDIVTISADGITGTIGANTFAVAANGQYALAWAATAN